ncbi:MAG TPA: peptide ligase PGM1-related protein [Nostocaceae cyanobacterium]|nr:peptide ligase PGM1-related protein [Nostocaceae cyanobacterium]
MITRLNISDLEQMDSFRALQGNLRDRTNSSDFLNNGEADILVIPSLSLDQRELNKIEGHEHYEERLLFSLIRLRNPHTRLIYVTSMPLHPSIIDYYLHLLPGIPFSHARHRLLLLSTYDAAPKPLSQKILERPRLLNKITQALRLDKAFMVCYNSSFWEAELSLKLGVPLYAAAPDLQIWGTKSGSRQIFAQSNVPFPAGKENIQNIEDLAIATANLWEQKSNLQKVVVKLNEGISGEGNAILDLRSLSDFAPGKVDHLTRVAKISDRLPDLRFQAGQETWLNFSQRIRELGCIVEEFVEGKNKRSPSVQGCITPRGDVEILSTHDQILGGPDSQIYLGCRFPADAQYRLQLQKLGLQIGQKLAEKGALERFGVDFITVEQENGNWEIQAIEINLRKGGTTHPFMTLKLLTNGHYDLSTGLFYSQQGKAKYYIATDNLQKNSYRGLLPNDLMDIIADHRLHFDSCTETGTVFHLMGCLSQFGKLGLTSIGDSPEQAEEIYHKVVNVLDQETNSDNNSYILYTNYAFPIIGDGYS